MCTNRHMANVIAIKLGSSVRVCCPECGHEGPHDSQGSTHDPEAVCSGCGEIFELEIEVTAVSRSPREPPIREDHFDTNRLYQPFDEDDFYEESPM